MWQTPPFELTERNGRWYGRGAADCKGNIVMHLIALRALGQHIPLNLKLLVEGAGAMLETCGSAGKGMKEGAPSRMMFES
jgi:acetylornithine deacetylase/succinyl-diaminopimelate desuccinylase-like protein